MPQLSDIIVPNLIKGYWDKYVLSNPPYLFSGQLLPARTITSEHLDYIVGQDAAPKVIGATSLDANTIFDQRSGFDTKSFVTPYFKRGYYLDETTQNQIAEVLANGDAAAIQTVQQNIFNDVERLLNNLFRTNEVMAAQAITTGKIDYQTPDSAVRVQADYDVPDNHKGNSVKPWSDPTADIVTDFQNVTDAMSDAGVIPAAAIMNLKTFRQLTVNDTIVKRYNVLAGQVALPSLPTNTVIEQLQQETNIKPVVYNKTYPDPTTNKYVPFVPDGVVIFIPLDVIGYMNYSPTPDQTAPVPTNVTTFYNNIALATWYDHDPGKVMLRAGERALPSLEGAHSIYILNTNPKTNGGN